MAARLLPLLMVMLVFATLYGCAQEAAKDWQPMKRVKEPTTAEIAVHTPQESDDHLRRAKRGVVVRAGNSAVVARAGQAVVREGQAGDRFYVIAEGEFDVSCLGGSFPSLAGGDVFGEIALLRDVPRTATVTARTDGRVFALDRDSFLTAVGGHRFSARTVYKIASERAECEPSTPLV